MNTMTAALIDAGVQLPAPKERIWRAIKEAPGICTGELRQRLSGIPAGTIGSGLSDLEQRGMAYSRMKYSGLSGRMVKSYYTDMDTYTQLPLPKKEKPTIKLVETQKDKSQETGFVPLDKTTPETTKGFDLDSLTIAEARALYQRLHKMFGESE